METVDTRIDNHNADSIIDPATNFKDLVIFGSSSILMWIIVTWISFNILVKEHGTGLESYFIFPYSLFYAGASFVFALILFKILKTSKKRVYAPLVLGVLYLLYFLLYSSWHRSDLSSKYWETSIICFLPPMFGYMVLSLKHCLKNKRITAFLFSSLFGLIVALLITFPNRTTDKIMFFYVPEMNRLDISKISEVRMGLEQYTVHVWNDRGINQSGDISYKKIINNQKKSVHGDFQSKISSDKFELSKFNDFFTSGPSSSNDYSRAIIDSFELDGIKIDYQYNNSQCEYIWSVGDYKFQYITAISSISLVEGETVDPFFETKTFASALIKNSLYLKN